MKKYQCTIITRIIIAAAALSIVFAHETVRGIFSSPRGSETLITEQMVRNYNGSYAFSVGIPDTNTGLSLLAANGGTHTAAESFYGKNRLSVKISAIEDPAELIRGFISGRFNIIALSPEYFTAVYPSIAELSPAAFLQNGSPAEGITLAGNESIENIPALKNKRIACVEKSPAHFLALYLLSINNISPGDIRWIFTLTGNEALALFQKKKADVVSYENAFAGRKIPSSAKIFFSTLSSPQFNRYVLIAKESDIALYRIQFEQLVKGHFESRKNYLTMKDADAASAADALGAHVPAGINPAALIPSADENFIFFRMTARRTWDYASAYAAARALFGIPDNAPGKIIAASQHIQLLESIDLSAYSRPSAQMPAPVIAQPESAFSLFTAELTCEKNTQELTFASKEFLRELSMRADLFPYAKITIKGGAAPDETNSAWLSGAREAAVKDIIARRFTTGYSRIYSAGGTPGSKTAVTVSFISAGSAQ